MPDLVNTERSPECAAAGRSCLSDDEILDFAAGRLASEQLSTVHAHVDRCGVCQRLIGEAVRQDVDADQDESGWATTFRSGDVIGSRYRVQRFIARGGMGEVYDAYDRDLQKRIALKTVLSSVSDSQRAVRRLKAEVQLAHRVSHPNVCRIYDLGAHSLGGNAGIVYFLTMEFVDGERLGERLKRGALTVATATRIARELLLGLSAAHAAGILHRDLKSDNIMLRPAPNDAAIPVILDFGLARTIAVDAGRVTSGVNGFMGTPCYMAPEQLEAGELTAASDLYALGVIWFEMLTGRLPFSLRKPFERLHKRPPRPSSVSAGVPPAIDKIVLRCLERVPEQRFGSAKDILAALDAVEARTPRGQVAGISGRGVRRGIAPALFGVALGVFLVFSRPHVAQPIANRPASSASPNATTGAGPSAPAPAAAAVTAPATNAAPAPTKSAAPDHDAVASPDSRHTAQQRLNAPRKRPVREPTALVPSALPPRDESAAPPTSQTSTPSRTDSVPATTSTARTPPPSASQQPPTSRPEPATLSPKAMGFADPFNRGAP